MSVGATAREPSTAMTRHSHDRVTDPSDGGARREEHTLRRRAIIWSTWARSPWRPPTRWARRQPPLAPLTRHSPSTTGTDDAAALTTSPTLP